MIEGDQKNGEHQRLPIVLDFAEHLKENRKPRGFVFGFPGLRVNRVPLRQAEKIITDLGELANVSTGKNKTATAHDFRRSFGLRYALQVMPQVLQKLM